MRASLIVSLAFRNLTRNVRRTLITSAAVIAGVSVLIMGFGLVDGLDENVIRAQEDTSSGHVLLRPAEFPSDNLNYPLDKAMPIGSELTAALSDDRIRAHATRLWFSARMVSGMDSVRMKVIGYDAEDEAAVFPRSEWTIDGAWPEGDAQIAMGSGLASMLKLSQGDTVILNAHTMAGSINAMPYQLTGTVTAGSPAVDAMSVWMPMEMAVKLVQPGEARTHIAVRLKRRGLSDGILPDLSVGGWTATSSLDEVADLIALNAFRRQAISLVVLILMLISALGIANTVIMATYERVREVGTLRAMGMSRRGIQALFLLEGGVMGLTAGVLGAGVGCAVVWWFASHGIDISGLTNSLGETSMSSTLYMQFTWGPVIFSLVFGFVVSILSSAYPAWHASTLNPADAVKAD
jgi:putative ABC transport system permease protein